MLRNRTVRQWQNTYQAILATRTGARFANSFAALSRCMLSWLSPGNNKRQILMVESRWMKQERQNNTSKHWQFLSFLLIIHIFDVSFEHVLCGLEPDASGAGSQTFQRGRWDIFGGLNLTNWEGDDTIYMTLLLPRGRKYRGGRRHNWKVRSCFFFLSCFVCLFP